MGRKLCKKDALEECFTASFKVSNFFSTLVGVCQKTQVTQGANCPIRSFPPLLGLSDALVLSEQA